MSRRFDSDPSHQTNLDYHADVYILFACDASSKGRHSRRDLPVSRVYEPIWVRLPEDG